MGKELKQIILKQVYPIQSQIDIIATFKEKWTK